MLGRLLLLGGAVVVIASLLPWHNVGELGDVTVNIDGIDSPNMGVVTLVLGAVLSVLGWRVVDAGDRPRRLALGAAIVTAAATVWVLIDAGNTPDRFDAPAAVERAYGQWVLLAGVVLSVVVAGLFFRAGQDRSDSAAS